MDRHIGKRETKSPGCKGMDTAFKERKAERLSVNWVISGKALREQVNALITAN